jgi:predicted PurR-regulated permease PerM
MEANPLMLFFGTLGGIMMFGFAGIILGPVAVALLNVTMRLFRREFRTPPAEAANP